MANKMVIVKQQDLKDCGVCCLSSIIQFYDGYVPIEKIRIDTKTSIAGTTAFNLFEAAIKYGFECKGIKVENLENPEIFLPAIAHLEYKNGLKHFVVIYDITKENVHLMDPAKGKVIIKKNEFLSDFTNIILMFYPTKKILFLEKGKSIINVFIKILITEKKIFIPVIIYSFLFSTLSIASGYYFKIGINLITDNSFTNYLKIIGVIFFVIIFSQAMFGYIRDYLLNHLSKNIDVKILSEFINHIFKIPSTNISSRTSGEIITRVNELASAKSLFIEIFIISMIDLILVFTVSPILFSINSKLFFVLFFIVIIYALIGLIVNRVIYEKAYNNIIIEEEFNNILLENIRAYKSIKNLNIINYSLLKIEEKLSQFLYDNYKLNNFLNKVNHFKKFIGDFGLFLIITLGLFQIENNSLSLTDLILFNSLFSFFLDPLKNILDVMPKYSYFKATFDKLSEFYNIEKDNFGIKEKILSNNIFVKNLNFGYDFCEDILKDKNLIIKSGEKVLLKGSSGCGKSTFCKILVQELENYKGIIKVGDINLKDYSKATIRNDIIYVSQNETLFNDTIMNNLLLDKKINKEDIENVSKICLLEEIVAKKKLRYDAFISNEFNFLSGGERQRIILARALLRKPKILILDETLSEVDYQLEKDIINNIRSNFVDVTLIYVTHKILDDLFDNVIDFGES